MNKTEIQNQENKNLVELVDQSGVETAIERLLVKNNSLLPDNVITDRIKNSAGFYISNRDDLMKLDGNGKLQMLYGVLKEAMVGCEAGVDYDIIPFKGKPTIIRNKNGWFKLIDMIKPAEIIRFTSNVIIEGDDYSFDPVTEQLTHKMNNTSDKYEDIVGAYAYIKFANGFEKTIFMSKKDINAIKKVSPSGNTAFSPWTTMPMKMVKTKVTKELAKDLFTLFSGRVNSTLAKAIESDEVSVKNIDNQGHIIDDNTIYDVEATVVEETKGVNLDEI